MSEGNGTRRSLFALNTPGYYVLLGLVAIFVLGPLGGITAAYMNFSLGFFIGGQVLAGILGSAVTLGYGAEGKHGANYMQTMAASVASMSGMAVLIQAMVWLGLTEPPTWATVVYFLCIGMFGVGVGMLYTPILVDKMQLTFPSGLAVANILRALTDVRLLKASIGKLGGGTIVGFVGGFGVNAPDKVAGLFGAPALSSLFTRMAEWEFSTSTIGAGMVVSARIALPGAVVGLAGWALTPWLRDIGWLDEHAPFRKIGFVIALGTILGAAIVDLTLIARQALKTYHERKAVAAPPAEDWKHTNMRRLFAWIAFWATGIVVMGAGVLHLPIGYVLLAIALVFLFLMVNGISQGISDSNPISSAFVIAVFIMASVGLKDPGVGLLCAAILLISCSVGVDMQQDRSTGWRLGTNRIIQFRYQVIGVFMGAVLCVVLAKLFMSAYPVLRLDQYSGEVAGAEKWQSAMTYKFVGALQGLTNPSPIFGQALGLGITLGVLIEGARKWLKGIASYRAFVASSSEGFAFDFCIDAFLLPSPYASSFGGFVNFPTTLWFALGGVTTSVSQTIAERMKARAASQTPAAAGDEALPEDMSTTALAGGGLIAGDSLAALAMGIIGLLATLGG
ncbi:OPT/YSL family transporter [Myxococcota bacterium]|nr:OPT/YSL family transporter [Myxococcota bacterium]